jgi:hypothetical protein
LADYIGYIYIFYFFFFNFFNFHAFIPPPKNLSQFSFGDTLIRDTKHPRDAKPPGDTWFPFVTFKHNTRFVRRFQYPFGPIGYIGTVTPHPPARIVGKFRPILDEPVYPRGGHLHIEVLTGKSQFQPGNAGPVKGGTVLNPDDPLLVHHRPDLGAAPMPGNGQLQKG